MIVHFAHYSLCFLVSFPLIFKSSLCIRDISPLSVRYCKYTYLVSHVWILFLNFAYFFWPCKNLNFFLRFLCSQIFQFFVLSFRILNDRKPWNLFLIWCEIGLIHLFSFVNIQLT